MATLGIDVEGAKKAIQANYLAKLTFKNGEIHRQFAKKQKYTAGTSRWFMLVEPGEVAELRGSHWDGATFKQGQHWLINDGRDRLVMVDRDTAMAFVKTAALPSPSATGSTLPATAPSPVEQILPWYIRIWNEDDRNAKT